jgi:hypothetical protein
MDIQVQQQIANIVNIENERVDLKKLKVDNELQTQNRLITLNNSYRQKYNDYNTLYIIFIVFLVTLCGIMLIKRYIPIIPSSTFDIAFIIVIPLFCIILVYKYLDISKHDDINYDEIKRDNPTILTPEEVLQKKVETEKKILNSGSLLSSYSGCIGAKCCSETNTKWDSGNSVCVAKDGFTTINYALINGEIGFSKVNGNTIQPNSPNEFESYSKI